MSGDFVCNVCGKQFGAKKTLSQHNWAVQTEFESNCTHCDKTFRSKKKLTYHMRSTHAENEVFHCDLKFGDIQCSYYSTSNSNLRVHVKRVHEKAGNKAANAHFFVVRVTTERIWRLAWHKKVAQNQWNQMKTCATCVTKRFQRRRSCISIQKCTTKKILLHQPVLLLVLSVRKRLQRNQIWKGIR